MYLVKVAYEVHVVWDVVQRCVCVCVCVCAYMTVYIYVAHVWPSIWSVCMCKCTHVQYKYGSLEAYHEASGVRPHLHVHAMLRFTCA